MIHLIKLIKGKTNIKRKYTCPPNRGDHIVYIINGYPFWLNHTMWADWRGMSRGTIGYRIKIGCPMCEALGFKKIKRKKNETFS